MKIDLLRTVMDEASKMITQAGLSNSNYYMYEDEWYSLNTKAKVSTPEKDALTDVELLGTRYIPKAKKGWFYINEHSAAIAIQFKTSARATTIEKYREKIDSIIVNSTNAYNVSHNTLTGLFSRDHFRGLVEQYILQSQTDDLHSADASSEVETHNSVSLLAFDIDKFKQVNDTYGHLYGDQVLKCFAMRLEEAKHILLQELGSHVVIELAHPSGEEFFALVVGMFSEEEIRTIAERFREKIAETFLPSDPEWKILKNKSLANVILPPLYERKITTSVGVASYPDTKSSLSTSTVMDIFDKSDIALYRSKAAGRNRVTLSQEILQNCGRVLEHDQTTGVVVVDIGSDIGVQIGQEFKVFPPTFSGNTPYIDDDGRSKRILGTYPKVEIARITVFNAQKEISFAVVSYADKTKHAHAALTIPTGSMLEAVPLGNIAHLIENQQYSYLGGVVDAPSVMGWKDLHEYLQQISDTTEEGYAAVFRFKNEAEFLKKYGSAALNQALAKLYSDAKKKFEPNAKIGVIDKTSICVIGKGTSTALDGIGQLLESSSINNNELGTVCGYVCPQNADPSHPPLIHSLELARFTASIFSAFKKSNVMRFSIQFVEEYLGEQRSSKSYGSAVADYLRFKEMGVISHTMENTAGLCYFMQKEYLLALECFERASAAAPTNSTYRSNAVTAAYKAKEYDRGAEILFDQSEEQINAIASNHPYGFHTYALLLAQYSGTSSKYFNKARFIQIASKAMQLNGYENASENAELNKIIQSLQS